MSGSAGWGPERRVASSGWALGCCGSGSDADPRIAARELVASGLVEYAEPNYIRQPLAVPDDTNFDDLWAHDNDGTNGNGAGGSGFATSTAGADMNTTAAWDIRTAATGIRVAIIDDGFDLDHPDLDDNLHQTDGRQCASSGGNANCAGTDPNPDTAADEHGTWVASAWAPKVITPRKSSVPPGTWTSCPCSSISRSPRRSTPSTTSSRSATST